VSSHHEQVLLRKRADQFFSRLLATVEGLGIAALAQKICDPNADYLIYLLEVSKSH
jgi:hypothetical protein